MLIMTRWLIEAQVTIANVTVNAFSSEQNESKPRSRLRSSEKANGRTTSPVSKSAPAREASSMVELFRSRRLVATAKMTSAFRRVVDSAAIKSIQTRATRCLYVSSRKYSARQTGTEKLHFSFFGCEDLERIRVEIWGISTSEVFHRWSATVNFCFKKFIELMKA